VLSKVDVTNRRGNVLSLEMLENDDGIQINDIDGLDPVRATFVSSSYANSDGEQYQSARRGSRNITMKLDLDPDFITQTYSSLRSSLYSYFMPKSMVKLRFYMDSGLYVDIDAFVEDFAAPRFEEDPMVTISLMCFKPDFIDPRMVTIEGNTVNDGTNVSIDYPGNVESGMVLTLNVNRDLSSFTIYNLGEDGVQQQLDFGQPLIAGDQLVVSSLKGSKGITLTRSGVSSSMLYGRSAQSSWIEFNEGINLFRVYALGDPIPYELEYVVRYGAL
jgi:hypothetical protein